MIRTFVLVAMLAATTLGALATDVNIGDATAEEQIANFYGAAGAVRYCPAPGDCHEYTKVTLNSIAECDAASDAAVDNKLASFSAVVADWVQTSGVSFGGQTVEKVSHTQTLALSGGGSAMLTVSGYLFPITQTAISTMMIGAQTVTLPYPGGIYLEFDIADWDWQNTTDRCLRLTLDVGFIDDSPGEETVHAAVGTLAANSTVMDQLMVLSSPKIAVNDGASTETAITTAYTIDGTSYTIAYTIPYFVNTTKYGIVLGGIPDESVGHDHDHGHGAGAMSAPGLMLQMLVVTAALMALFM